MTSVKPSLELTVQVTDATGVRTRWDSGAKDAANRPQGLSFSTKRGEGFAEASVTLARRVDRDYVDLHLFDDISFFGADGSVAYEGRVAAMPRSFDQAHSVGVQCAGWMSHARDNPFTEIFVDRDLSAWTPPSRTRSAALLASNVGIHSFEVTRDVTSSPAIAMRIEGNWVSPYKPIVEVLYDAGYGNAVSIVYVWLRAGSAIVDSTFEFYVQGGPDDTASDITSADLWAGVDNAAYRALSAPRRFATMQFVYNTTPAGAAGANFGLYASNVAVYGSHGLSVIGSTDPMGFAASDVIRYIVDTHCPKLNSSKVQSTTYPIPHLVFKDYTDPYDAFLEVNKYHLWELAVWEDRTLSYGPADLTDYDWEIRLSDYGTSMDWQGDTTEDLYNGIVVTFTNVVTGATDTLHPSLYSDLLDVNPNNPANQHGIPRYKTLKLSTPTTTGAAVAIGQAALLEANSPKAPGSFNVTGHIRDREGHWQPGWKVRAGDTVAITDHPNDSPRLITETSWDHDQQQLRITTDNAMPRLDAVIDRIGAAMTAAGLS